MVPRHVSASARLRVLAVVALTITLGVAGWSLLGGGEVPAAVYGIAAAALLGGTRVPRLVDARRRGWRHDQVETLGVIGGELGLALSSPLVLAGHHAVAPVVYAGLALHLALAGFVVWIAFWFRLRTLG